MTPGSLAAALAAFPLMLVAQPITASLSKSPDGTEEIKVRNGGASEIVAFVVYAPRASDGLTGETPRLAPDAPFLFFLDLLDPGAKSLAAGEERSLTRVRFAPRRGKPVPIFEESLVSAGILADGTTVGDPFLLRRLLLRRCNLLQAVEVSLEMLNDAGRRNVPREDLIQQFTRMADSLRHWYLPPEQQAGREVYRSIIGRLTSLPSQPPGAPFPPSAFVDEETAQLNRRRIRLLESQPSLAAAALLGR